MPLMTALALLTPLRVLELRGKFFVLYDQRFALLKNPRGLPVRAVPLASLPPLRSEDLEDVRFAEPEKGVNANTRFNIDDAIGHEVPETSAIANEVGKMVKKVCKDLIAIVNSEVAVYPVLKNQELCEQYCTFCHHLDDCNALDDSHKQVTKIMAFERPSDIKHIFLLQ